MAFFHPHRTHWKKLEVRGEDGKPVEHASGAEFLLGFIPHGKLSAIDDASFEAAIPVRQLLKEMKDTGTNRQLTEKEESELAKWRKAAGKVDEDYVRYGIRGHKNILDDEGKEVPFESTKENFAGREIEVVSEKTMEFYRLNGLIGPLSMMAFKLQRLPETTRGN